MCAIISAPQALISLCAERDKQALRSYYPHEQDAQISLTLLLYN